ncbi:MAG: alpha/beta fold hydrolase [Pseudomonadota bacterium]
MSEDIETFVIEQLYEVVSSPDKYDEFMRTLEAKLVTLRAMQEKTPSPQIDSHLERASSLVDVISPWHLDDDSALSRVLSNPLQPLMAVGQGGSVIKANTAARVTFDLPPRASLHDLPIAPKEKASLKAAIHAMLKGHDRRNAPNNVLRYQNLRSDRPLLLTLERFEETENAKPLVIVKTSDICWPAHLGPILRNLFALTRAETEVLRLLVIGTKVEDIADQRRCSLATVRSQLRSIYGKTETSSQMDCVRLIFGLSLMHTGDEGRAVADRIQASAENSGYPRPGQRKTLDLPDGRTLEYSVFGANSNKTILFMHDQAFGDTWFRDAVEDATRAGLQIVAPLRPGFGRTTLYEGEASDPHRFAPDVKALLDHLTIAAMPVIAMRSGFVHALALAQLIPDRIQTVTVANPILPVLEDADLEGTNGYNRLIPHTRLHFPKALKFLCKAGFAFVTAKGPEAFALSVFRASPQDVEWASRPDILPIITSGLYVHEKNGYRGNYGDLAYAEDWSDLLTHAPCPIRLVIGEHDRNVQWAASERWAAGHDHIDLHILPNSGYMVFHQQNGQFLKWAIEDMKLR